MDPEFIVELFAPFGSVTVRRMFGGAGLFAEGMMFGLVFDGAIFLKVDDASIPDFEREGSVAFVYTRAKSPGRPPRTSPPSSGHGSSSPSKRPVTRRNPSPTSASTRPSGN